MFDLLKTLIMTVVFILFVIIFPVIMLITLITADSSKQWKEEFFGVYRMILDEIPYLNIRGGR